MAALQSPASGSVYRIKDHGTLRLPIPASWVQAETEADSSGATSQLVFWLPDSRQLPACMMIVQFLPAPEQDRLRQLGQLASHGLEFLKPTLADPHVALLPVPEAREGGWYFFATTQAPPVAGIPGFDRVCHAYVLAGGTVLQLELHANDFGTASKCLAILAQGAFD